ncbi:CHAT domain-containing protein [Nonomuraea sp. SBT364]|uniref:CHAT domain-containing protein n=1 Tax=Nonomuraea sp. SBT364 TaxID=1580530 RepID=UPI00066D8E2F|nr:CHAT domain-containing protein [Nonomuraea sp. SBT364]
MRPEEHIERFMRTGDVEALEAGIAGYRRALRRDEDPALLAGLGNAMSMRYGVLRVEADLEEAIGLHRRAVAGLAARPGLADARAGLATVLGNQRGTVPGRLEEALELYAAALGGELEDRALVLANYGMALMLRHEATLDRADLLRGIEALRESVRRTDRAGDRYLWRLAKLASSLVLVADEPANARELKAAMEEVRARYGEASEPVKQEIQLLLGALMAVDEIPVITPEMLKRFRTLPTEQFMGPGGRSRYLAGLGGMLIEDVRSSGRLDRADQAVELFRQAVAQAPPGHPETAQLLIGLGAVLGLRMEFSGTTGDLDEMIDALRRGVAAADPQDEHVGMYRSDLANALMLKFHRGGGRRVLDEAVRSYRRALAESPQHAERAMALTGLGSALSYRYELTGNLDELDESVDSHRAAVTLTGPDHQNYALYLANLGATLEQRYERTRRGEDTDEAARVMRDAVAATPDSSPYRPGYLGNLASVLLERYRFTGQTAALREAVERAREAVLTVHPGNDQRPGVLNNLGTVLLQTGEDLDEAIDAFRDARAAAVPGTALHTRTTVNLGGALLVRALSPGLTAANLRTMIAQALGEWTPEAADADQPDLEEAIALLNEAIRAEPSGGTAAYAHLGGALRKRFQVTGRARDLRRAVRMMRAAVDTCPPADPGASTSLYFLAETLTDQWRMTGSPAPRDEAVTRYRQASQVETAAADWRVEVGRRWGEFAMEADLAQEAAEGFAAAVSALHEAAWRGLGRDDQERVLRAYEGLARDAAAAAIRAGDPGAALELLEEGRGVMLTQVIDHRTSRALLHAAVPPLADALGEVQDALAFAERMDLSDDLSDDPAADRARQLDQRPALRRRREEIIAEIRALPGFADFLGPPRRESLLRVAADGPVAVLNVSRYGCDALLVTSDEIRALPLAITSGRAQERAAGFARAVEDRDNDEIVACLGWLWDHVTGPVLAALGPVTRVWWCPTGPLSLLPIHAAGEAPERVISSYTPTLRALKHARDQAGPVADRPAMVVGVPSVAGEVVLKGVDLELEAVRPRLPQRVELYGDAATHERVLAELDDSAVVHFACHAVQDPTDPSSARLLLYDRPLTVRELSVRHLPRAELAFLSGCETSRGGAVLTDEAVAIATAVQLAGFPHVIGALWPISDLHAPAVAAEVYAVLTAGGTRDPDPAAAATALHVAIRALRARRPGFPVFWASYVHVGP